MFSSKSFIVSGVTFRSLIHFEVIFVYGVRKCSSFILLHVVEQFSQKHLLKRLSFLHCIFLPPLSKTRCPQARGFISGLSILNNRKFNDNLQLKIFRNCYIVTLLLNIKHKRFGTYFIKVAQTIRLVLLQYNRLFVTVIYFTA